MSAKNRLFAKYGHDCTIPSSLEDLYMFKSTNNILTQIRNLVIRWRMASELNYRSQSFLRSQKALDMEHKRQLKHLYIIHPFSDLRKWWESFMIVILLIQFIMIPIDVSVQNVNLEYNLTSTSAWRVGRLICDCICLIDVIVTFFTGYCDYKKRIVILDPKKIAVHYLLTYFIPDFFSSVPTEFEAFGEIDKEHTAILRHLTYMSVMKLFRFFTFVRYCRQFCHTYAIQYPTYKITMIVLCYALYYHIVCCLTIYIVTRPHTGIKEPPTSVYRKSRIDMPFNLLIDIKTTYFYIFYESTRMITNTGFAKIGNSKYMLYTIPLWIISRVVYMYMLALVVDLIISKTSAVQKYFEMVKELKDYMRHKQLPEYLQRRLLGYYEFRFQKSYFRESEILTTISGHLRQDVIMHSCRKLVENVDFFKNLPLSLLVRIVSAMRLELFLTHDVVLKVNTPGDCMYFIATGTVAIYSRSGHEVCHLSDGEHFGEIALVMKNETRIASVVAVETSEMYRLDKSDFVRAIMPYPDLLYKIQRIALERWEYTMALDERSVNVNVTRVSKM